MSAIHVLVAACDVRESVGHDSTTSGSPPDTPRAEACATKLDRRRRNGKPGSGVNVSRDRMKQEMQHLRDTVAELQRQLDEIKRDHVRRSPRSPVPPSPSTTQLVAAWEAMARGQCEQRYRAEVENVKLRKMLDEQVKIAQTLDRILTKRRNSEQLFGSSRGSKRSRPSSSPNPIDSPTVFADLEMLLPSLYAQVDMVFGKDCFLSRDESFRTVEVRHAEETGTYVESTEKRLLPFSFQDTADAMWEFLVFYPDDRDRESWKKHDLYRDSLTREIDMKMQLERFSGELLVKYKSRRYVEKDRVVIVWVALADPSDVSDSPLDGACIRHTGWMCARRSSIVGDSSMMSEFLTAQLSVPEYFDSSSDRKRRVCALTNYLVSSLNWQLDTNKQIMDNRLLERALSRSRPVKNESSS